MRETTEVEAQLRRLFRPIGNLVRWIVGLWVFRQFGRLLTFLASPFLRVWNRYWSYIQGDDIPDEAARVPGFMQKAMYQRYVWLYWPVIIIFVAAISIGILSQEPTMVTIADARPLVTVADLYAPHKDTTSSDSIPGAKQNVPHIVQHGDGFLGLRDLRASDKPVPTLDTTVASKIFATTSDKPYMPEEPISFSPVVGDLDTVIVPEDADYEWTEASEDTVPSTELVTRGPMLIDIVMPDVPFSAEDMGIGGYVEILALIGPDGNYAYYAAHAVDTVDTSPECILEVIFKNGTKGSLEFYIDVDSMKNEFMYLTIVEKANDVETDVFKFADRLYEVLPQWKFAPPLYDSKPAYAFVRIGFNFCAPDDEDCIEIILNPVHSSAS